MSIKIKIPEGVDPVPGSVFVMPVESLEKVNSKVLAVDFETPAHQAAVVLIADPLDVDEEVKAGDLVYYGSHAASGVEVKGQMFLTVPRDAIIGVFDVEPV